MTPENILKLWTRMCELHRERTTPFVALKFANELILIVTQDLRNHNHKLISEAESKDKRRAELEDRLEKAQEQIDKLHDIALSDYVKSKSPYDEGYADALDSAFQILQSQVPTASRSRVSENALRQIIERLYRGGGIDALNDIAAIARGALQSIHATKGGE